MSIKRAFGVTAVLAALLVFSAWQINNGGGSSGAGTVTTTGSPASGQVAVMSAATSITSDSGLAYNSSTKALGVIGKVISGQAGTASGDVDFNGTTSGTASITGPAVAGTATNPFVFSNSISTVAGGAFSTADTGTPSITGGTNIFTLNVPFLGANGSSTNPTYSFTNKTTGGMYWDGSTAVFVQAANNVSIKLASGDVELNDGNAAFKLASRIFSAPPTGGGTFLSSSAGPTGFAIDLKSTSGITGSVPVKMDTGNANQVVVTTTSDIGGGLVVGVSSGNISAGQFGQIYVSGIATMTLGTGTCAIGQFVIVDTTTNGRVQCTSVYAAGTVIGVAMAAQASVGSTFNVLIGLR